MRGNRLKFLPLTVFALLTSIVYGCKGRTLDNVEPTGDTIEVVINSGSTDTNFNDSIVNIDEI